MPELSISLDVPLIVLAGAGIGLLISAPIGPVNVLCIQRTLARGYWAGVAAGLGAVMGDGLVSALAAFGLTAIETGMDQHRQALQLVGGAILLAFGVRLLASHPSADVPAEQKQGLRSNAAIVPQTFLLCVTNPGAVLGIFALIGSLSSVVEGDYTYLHASLLVLAIMGGSLAWWMSLAWLIAIIHHKLDENRLRLINQLAGVVLIGFGVGLLARFVWALIA